MFNRHVSSITVLLYYLLIWLPFTGANSMKRKLKEEYCIQRKTFDRLNRKYKRKFEAQERQKIEDKLSEINQYDFWKSIGKIGIANERKNCIPLAVVDNDGRIKTDKNDVLNKWKNDFHALFQRNGTRDIGLDNSEFNTEIDVSLLNGPITRDEVLQACCVLNYEKQ